MWWPWLWVGSVGLVCCRRGRWYMLTLVGSDGRQLNWNGENLARQADDRGLESWKNRMEVDHENRRSLWSSSAHSSPVFSIGVAFSARFSQCRDVIDVRSAGGRGRGEVWQRFPETEDHVKCNGGQERHRQQATRSSLCCVAHSCCDARLHWTRRHWTQAQHDRLASSSVKQRLESGLAETEQDQLSSLPVEVTHKTGITITATSRGTMPGD